MKKLLLGNAAIARGAYEYGITVATGYPGTPSTEITEEMVQYKNIKAQWSPNEKVALEVGIRCYIESYMLHRNNGPSPCNRSSYPYF